MLFKSFQEFTGHTGHRTVQRPGRNSGSLGPASLTLFRCLEDAL